MKPDLIITDQGTMFLFVPLTQEALDWIEENVHSEDWQWHYASRGVIGNGLSVDARYAEDLTQRAIDAGLVVV